MTRALVLSLIILTVAGCKKAPTELVWESDESTALSKAKRESKRVLVDFGAIWCAPCTEYEKKTFVDPVVIDYLQDWVLLRFDVTELSDTNKALMERYQVDTLPAILVLDREGVEVARITEFLPPAPFLDHLKQLPARE